MSVNGLPRNDHKVKGKHRVETSITCAKRTKWRVYTYHHESSAEIGTTKSYKENTTSFRIQL